MVEATASPEADMRVRQNYALVLALDGKFAEAEHVAERDLSPADAAASVSAIRGMIAQSNTWSALQKPAAPKPKAARPAVAANVPVP
jgi:Flp pilus assembly protein TadD